MLWLSDIEKQKRASRNAFEASAASGMGSTKEIQDKFLANKKPR